MDGKQKHNLGVLTGISGPRDFSSTNEGYMVRLLLVVTDKSRGRLYWRREDLSKKFGKS